MLRFIFIFSQFQILNSHKINFHGQEKSDTLFKIFHNRNCCFRIPLSDVQKPIRSLNSVANAERIIFTGKEQNRTCRAKYNAVFFLIITDTGHVSSPKENETLK
jgi:hypothetical protein